MTTGALTIQDNDTVDQYTAVGESTFVFNFPILETDELKVSRNQVLLTHGVDYSITGLGDDGGGYITLLLGASTPGDVWTLWQDMPIERLTGFSAGAATILGAALNAEFSARLRVEQQLRREIRNSLRLPPDDPLSGQDMVLPLNTVRAGMYLAFDALGAPYPANGTGNDSALRADLAATVSGADGARLVGYRRTEAGSVAQSVYSKLLRELWVEDFGAVGDGVTDSTVAIQNAIAAAQLITTGCRVRFGPGDFKFSSTLTVSHDRIHLVGMGLWATRLIFAPTANDTAIEFNNGASPVYQCSFRDILLFSNDSTYTKVGLDLFDVRDFLLTNCGVGGGVGISGVSYWAGNTASIGVRTRGREFFCSRDVYIAADKPYSIAGNPNDIRDIDHFRFVNQLLIANGNPIVTVEDEGINLSNVSFEGYQSWNKGTHGFYWVQTGVAPVAAGIHLTFDGVRTEQGTDAAAQTIHIEMHASSSLQDLTLRDCGLDSARGGLYLRRVEHIVLDSVKNPGTTNVALDITFVNNTYLVNRNCLWNTGSTATLTNARVLLGTPNAPSQAAFANGEYGFDGNTSRNLTLGGALSEYTVTLADAATAELGTTTTLGKLFVSATVDNAWAEFNMRGTNNVTAEMADPQGLFSAAVGTASSTNVYWDGGTSRYRIQNLRGGSRTYRILMTGTYN